MNLTPKNNLYLYLEKYLSILDSSALIESNYSPDVFSSKYTFSVQNSMNLQVDMLDRKNINNVHCKIANSLEDEHFIWQFWWQGLENAPPIIQKCVAQVKKYYGKQHIFLDASNYLDYIEIPDFIERKFQKNIISYAHFSDYVRLALLEKYGGTWIDASVLLSAPLPHSILTQEFYVMKFPNWFNINEINILNPTSLFDVEPSKRFPFRSSPNWFIHAFKNNILIKATKILLTEYWKHEDTLIHYFVFHAIFSMAILHKKECRTIFEQIKPVFKVPESHLMKYYLFKEFSQATFSQICNRSSIHKLRYNNLEAENIHNSFLNHILGSEI